MMKNKKQQIGAVLAGACIAAFLGCLTDRAGENKIFAESAYTTKMYASEMSYDESTGKRVDADGNQFGLSDWYSIESGANSATAFVFKVPEAETTATLTFKHLNVINGANGLFSILKKSTNSDDCEIVYPNEGKWRGLQPDADSSQSDITVQANGGDKYYFSYYSPIEDKTKDWFFYPILVQVNGGEHWDATKTNYLNPAAAENTTADYFGKMYTYRDLASYETFTLSNSISFVDKSGKSLKNITLKGMKYTLPELDIGNDVYTGYEIDGKKYKAGDEIYPLTASTIKVTEKKRLTNIVVEKMTYNSVTGKRETPDGNECWLFSGDWKEIKSSDKTATALVFKVPEDVETAKLQFENLGLIYGDGEKGKFSILREAIGANGKCEIIYPSDDLWKILPKGSGDSSWENITIQAKGGDKFYISYYDSSKGGNAAFFPVGVRVNDRDCWDASKTKWINPADKDGVCNLNFFGNAVNTYTNEQLCDYVAFSFDSTLTIADESGETLSTIACNSKTGCKLPELNSKKHAYYLADDVAFKIGDTFIATEDTKLFYKTDCLFGAWVDERPAKIGVDGTKGYYPCELCDKKYDADYSEISDLSVPALKGLKFGSISLGGDIGLNFYVYLGNDATLSPTAVLSAENKVDVHQNGVWHKGSGCYVFTYPLAPKDYKDRVKISVVGENIESTFCVEDYARLLPETDSAYALTQAMLAYCEAARAYFAGETVKNATGNITDDLSAYKASATGEKGNITAVYFSVVLETKTTICIYFRTDEALPTCRYGNDTLTPEKVVEGDNLYVIRLQNISSDDFGKSYEVAIGSLNVSYSVYAYINTQKTTQNIALGNVVRALYAYGKCASDYFAEE